MCMSHLTQHKQWNVSLGPSRFHYYFFFVISFGLHFSFPIHAQIHVCDVESGSVEIRSKKNEEQAELQLTMVMRWLFLGRKINIKRILWNSSALVSDVMIYEVRCLNLFPCFCALFIVILTCARLRIGSLFPINEFNLLHKQTPITIAQKLWFSGDWLVNMCD